jgi:hypothetical protein
VSDNTSPIPPGAMLEAGIELIDEGAFVKEINAKLRQAHKAMLQYEEETGQKDAKVGLAINITLARLNGSKEFLSIEATCAVKLPQPVKRLSTAVEKAGRMLCQPVGTNDDPTQQLYFDHRGQIIGGNPDAVIDESGAPVAGRIKRAQA